MGRGKYEIGNMEHKVILNELGNLQGPLGSPDN